MQSGTVRELLELVVDVLASELYRERALPVVRMVVRVAVWDLERAAAFVGDGEFVKAAVALRRAVKLVGVAARCQEEDDDALEAARLQDVAALLDELARYAERGAIEVPCSGETAAFAGGAPPA